MTPDQAIARLWEAGQLLWKLHATQERMRAAICRSDANLYVVNCARRLGKTYLACLLAIEQCLQLPGSQVRYAAPTAKAVRKMVTPNMKKILADCPAHLRPTWNSVDGVWAFPNGSEIHVAGVNNGHADDLRGVESHLAIVDEAGYVRDGSGVQASTDADGEGDDDEGGDALEYLVGSVLEPQLLTTDGRIVLLSTPPKQPGHSFVAYCSEAEAVGAYSKYTLRDALHIPPERIERFIAKAGGERANKVRREYFAEFVIDATRAVLPEWGDHAAHVVREYERPAYFIPIIVLDVGYHDQSHALFGYHDIRAHLDVVEAEYAVSKRVASQMTREIDAVAVGLWGEVMARKARRFADAPAIVVAELGPGWSGIAKKRTDGDYLAAAVNDVRERVRDHSTVVTPQCPKLIRQCENATWKKPGKDFDRLAGFGHFDGMAALAYFTRLVDRRTNPYPARDPSVNPWTHHMEPVPDRANLALLGAGARRQ